MENFNTPKVPKKVQVTESSYCSPQGSLYLRLTTAEVENTPKDDSISDTEKTVPEPVPDKITRDVSVKKKRLKPSCVGMTFIEEKEERARQSEYNTRVKIKLEQRALWKAFCKHIERYKIMKRCSTTRPRWFQELSSSQESLLDTLHTVLSTDSGEKLITCMKRFLHKLGIAHTLDSKSIEKAVFYCELDPLVFLQSIKKEVNDLENKSYQKNESQLASSKRKRRPITVSEKILLSSIVYIYLPILLFKLHLILPEPVQRKSEKLENVVTPLHVQEVLAELNKEESLRTYDSGSQGTIITIIGARERKSQDFIHGEKSLLLSISSLGSDRGSKKLQDKPDEAKQDNQDPVDFPSFQSFHQTIDSYESHLQEPIMQAQKEVKKTSSDSLKYQSSCPKVEDDQLEVLLTKIKEKVKKQPIHKQLQFALKIVAEFGDPVAHLPDLYKHPVIQKWFGIRRGIIRRLSEKEKYKKNSR